MIIHNEIRKTEGDKQMINMFIGKSSIKENDLMIDKHCFIVKQVIKNRFSIH